MRRGFATRSHYLKGPPPPLVTQCGACGLSTDCRTPRMPYFGEGRRGVLLVGEAPGATEDERGVPFVGESGQLLAGRLRRLGINMDLDCWRTNACVCRPPNNATPTAKQIDCCQANLRRTIETLAPKAVILLGKSALKSAIGHLWGKELGPLTRWVGYTIPRPKLRTWFCPTYHPAFLVRANNELVNKSFDEHLAKAVSLHADPPNVVIHVNRLYRPESIRRSLQLATSSTSIAFDFETTCLKPEFPGARIVSCAVSCFGGERVVAFPWTAEAKAGMRYLLRIPQPKIAANIKFEERWAIREFGEGVNGWWHDTVLAAHWIDNQPRTTSVKFQSFVQLGVDPYSRHIEPYLKAVPPGHLNRIHDVHLEDLLEYNGMDAGLEHLLTLNQRNSGVWREAIA